MNKEVIENLLKHAKQAAKNAYSPYSNYSVGSVVLTKSGDIFKGCNVENISYGLTICAERTAIIKAISESNILILLYITNYLSQSKALSASFIIFSPILSRL